jgi:hypothetical protein
VPGVPARRSTGRTVVGTGCYWVGMSGAKPIRQVTGLLESAGERRREEALG